jgi:positive phototaxis protein PixI
MQSLSLLSPEQLQQKTIGEPFLQLRLAPMTEAVISMEQAVEALIIPTERVNPVPNMPAWMIGLLNQRTRIYWVIDLPLLLGLPPVEPFAQRYSIILLRESQQILAIAVPEVIGVVRVETTQIISAVDHTVVPLAGCLQGYLMSDSSEDLEQKDEKRWVLDCHAIFQSVMSQLS